MKHNTEKTYASKLAGTLLRHKIDIEELQYIAERDFKRWRGVGKGTYEYACRMLDERGLSWGRYSYYYYIEHKAEIQADKDCGREPEKDCEGMDEFYFRRSVAKEIMAKLAGRTFRQAEKKDKFGVPYYDWETSCPPDIMAKKAVELTDALIEELR